MKRLLYIIGAVAFSWSQPCVAQTSELVQKADRFSAERLSSLLKNQVLTPNWIGDKAQSFYYGLEADNGDYTYYLYISSRKRRVRLFSTSEIYAKLNKDTSKGLDRLSKPINLKFDAKLSMCSFDLGREHYTFNLANASVVMSERSDEKKGIPFQFRKANYRTYSPDSLYYVTTKGHNLYLGTTSGDDEIQLTTDGEQYYSFALGGNNERNEHMDEALPIGDWSRTGNYFFMIREDKRKVLTMTIVNSLKRPRPVEKTYKFPMPGDTHVPQYEMWVVDAAQRKAYRIEIDKYTDQKIEMVNQRAADGVVYFIRRPRTNDRVELCKLTLADRRVEVLISDDCAPRLNEQLFNYRVLGRGKEILWWSERSGRGKYYLYDDKGKLKRCVSPNNYVSGSIVYLDSIKRRFIVEGYGGEKLINPHYRLYYMESLDRNHSVLLTPGNGDHSVQLSPDRNYLVDTYSRMDYAPTHELRKIDGEKIETLATCDLSPLYRLGWKEPKVERFLADDGKTPLYGVVYMPFDLDSTRKYPIITNVYPGPHTDLIPQYFSIDDNYNQSLAQMGFIVINVAYRGSGPYRGRDFYIYGQGNLRDYALADDQAVIRQMAERYPFVDLSRVGIYGHSGGGFMTVTAMLTSPDFYKVGVAASGNYDNNIYTQWWGETFHGVREVKDKTGKVHFESKIPTPMEMADSLKGNLLLITGDVDTNVHPANTFRLVHALMEANKRFDMFVIPGADHGLGDAYYTNMIRRYFADHLLHYRRENMNMINIEKEKE